MLNSKYQKRQRAQRAHAVVGIDAGKHRHALVVRPRGGEDTRPMLFTADRAGFERALAEIHDQTGGHAPSDILVGIEFAGNYGFTLAHFLDRRGYGVVSVLPAHTRRWKEAMHGQNLKTDPHDALGITDLTAQGHFVGFLDPVYADLRYLVSTRERLTRLRSSTWPTAWPATGGSTFPTPPGNPTARLCIRPVAGRGTCLRPHSARTQAGGWSP